MNITWENSVWFFDFDDTLVDTEGAGVAALDGLREYLKKHFDGEVAGQITDRFQDMFFTLMSGYRVVSEEGWKQIEGGKEAYESLLERVASVQPAVVEQLGHSKRWSREVLIKLVADDMGATLTPEMVDGASRAFWDMLARKTDLLPGARELVSTIQSHGRPVYIVTASDGHLKMQKDGTFIYDPKYSEDLKKLRFDAAKEKGLEFSAYRIGDPEDKPHLDFFEKITNVAKEEVEDFDFSNCIMLGDSYSGDLATPRDKMGFGLVVYVNPGQKAVKEEDDNYVSTGSLKNFLSWFEGEQ